MVDGEVWATTGFILAVVVPVTVAAAGLIVLATSIVSRRRRARWTRLAQAAGLREAPAILPGEVTPDLVGRRGGLDFLVRQYVTSDGGDSTRWTSVTALLPDWPDDRELRIVPDGLGARIAASLAGADVRVGDAGFDRAFYVRATDEDWARRALGSRARESILALRPFHELRVGRPLPASLVPAAWRRWVPSASRAWTAAADAVAAAPPAVTVLRRGEVSDPDRINATIDALGSVARELARET